MPDIHKKLIVMEKDDKVNNQLNISRGYDFIKIMENVIECYHCGLFVKKEESLVQKIKCPRCSSKLKYKSNHSLNSLYYAITALLLFILLNVYPLITLSLNGNELKATLFSSFLILFEQDFIFVSLLVFFTIILAPILNSLVIIFAFIQNSMKKKPFSKRVLFDGFHFFKNWGFIEVFIVSIIVTYIKLLGMVSTTRFDIGFYIMLAYVFMFYMSNKKFDIKSVLE